MIDIVIISHNYRQYIKPLLYSLNDCNHNVSQKIIVVDNNSTDGSRELIKDWFVNKNYGGYKYCLLPENKGYSYAVNYGAKMGDNPYIMILNVDMLVLDEDWKEKLLRVFDSNPGIGVVGCKLVDQFNKVVGAGTTGTFQKREFRAYGVDDSDNPKDIFNQKADCINVCGACYMVRREVFEKLGGFDEDFFMYHEEEYFSFKVQLVLGKLVFYTPITKFLHYSSPHKAENESKYISEAHKIFVRKCKEELGIEVQP